ncbi:hypothetical protein THAOC_17160 [Thalassiosira oceanica]|uniref:RNA helicase n=1 Tax=Thalassiosira oceanica TaxID=159749 RepID=K0SMU3_THAOC|nr:hypothetical protein THAOC_17160 [Thalassiosira oceanica]|eukprot:EJK62236.1 hypothetical protein THAOC_17160 [Thalassiosira oceanica]
MPDFLRANIGRMNYTSPTPIQRHSVPLASAGEDLMCCAQTGSGKTCAFLLPVVSSMTRSAGRWGGGGWGGEVGDPASPSCVVLAPTRELALQIELEAQKLTHVPDREDVPVDTVCVYGGAKARGQLQQLAVASRRPSAALLVVATPGRLTDFVERNLVSLNDVAFLVLDEADRMLDMGEANDDETTHVVVTEKLTRQFFYSPASRLAANRLRAADPPPRPEVRHAAAVAASNPTFLRYVSPRDTEAGGRVPPPELLVDCRRPRRLHDIEYQASRSPFHERTGREAQAHGKGAAGRTRGQDAHLRQEEAGRDQAQEAAVQRRAKGGPAGRALPPFKAQDIHGDRTQSQRETALAEFRQGSVLVLVATDVAARGLDISGVEHVINVDLPNAADEFDSYVHRIGRTGRAGHTGLATSLYVPGDDPKTGNGRIAGLLVAQLRESKQDVPDWLAGEAAGGRPPASAGGGPGHKRKGGEFGGTDVRGSGKKAEGPGRNQRRNGGGEGASQGAAAAVARVR